MASFGVFKHSNLECSLRKNVKSATLIPCDLQIELVTCNFWIVLLPQVEMHVLYLQSPLPQPKINPGVLYLKEKLPIVFIISYNFAFFKKNIPHQQYWIYLSFRVMNWVTESKHPRCLRIEPPLHAIWASSNNPSPLPSIRYIFCRKSGAAERASGELLELNWWKQKNVVNVTWAEPHSPARSLPRPPRQRRRRFDWMRAHKCGERGE